MAAMISMMPSVLAEEAALWMSRLWAGLVVAKDEIGEHLQAEEPHQGNHCGTRGEKGLPVPATVNLARDVGDGQHVRQRNTEQPRVGPHPRCHVLHVEQRRHRRHRVTNDEEDDALVNPAAQFVVQRAFGFHQRVDCPVHHEQGHGRHAQQQRVRLQQAPEGAGEFAPVINRDAPRDIAHRHTDQEARQDAAGAKPDVPHLPPPAHRLLAAELDGHRAEDQRHQQQHERQVKAREHGRIHVREGRKQRTAARHQPHLVAIPDRPDGVEHDAPLLVAFGEQMQCSHAQVEPVEHGVTHKQHPDEDEPDSVEIE